jgi:hypothetical protein
MSSRTRGGVLAVVLSALGACSTPATDSNDGGSTVDATPATSVTGTAVPLPDASVTPPADATPPSDATSPDASDAGPDDGGLVTDAASDAGGPVPVRPGVDGILRGTVTSVTYEHRWNGALRAGNANCPANASIVDGGGVMCCVWSRAFVATQAVNIPITFDLTTRTGTLAGSPIGTYSGPTPPDANGTVEYLINPSSSHRTKAWDASNAMGELLGESAALVAESRAFPALNLVYEVVMSLSAARVSWNATTSAFRIYETHPLVSIPTGRCGNQSSGGRLAYDLRSP